MYDKAPMGCAIIAAVVMMIGIPFLFGECTYVSQGEKVFSYDVTSGKAVNEADNPLRPMGFATAWGWNQEFFTVTGLINDYEFTGQGDSKDKYDETLNWNSNEGVVMSASYKLYGRVTNPWEFFVHFGEQDYKYQNVKIDERVYEALRQTGKTIDLHLNELTSNTDAETVRTTPEIFKQKLLQGAQEYMKQFGFEVTDMLFVGNFQYPDGNVIVDARKQITALDSEVRGLDQEKLNLANQAKINVQQAKIEAAQKIGEAQREASNILAESEALATALKQSIDEIGIEPTIRLKMAELYGKLAKDGVIPSVILTENSLFASPFYPSTGKQIVVSQPSSSNQTALPKPSNPAPLLLER